ARQKSDVESSDYADEEVYYEEDYAQSSGNYSDVRIYNYYGRGYGSYNSFYDPFYSPYYNSYYGFYDPFYDPFYRPGFRSGFSMSFGWGWGSRDRKSTRLNSSHVKISY